MFGHCQNFDHGARFIVSHGNATLILTKCIRSTTIPLIYVFILFF